MKRYRYTSNEIMRFSIGDNDFFLEKDTEVDLPIENEHVKMLILKGYLIEVVKKTEKK